VGSDDSGHLIGEMCGSYLFNLFSNLLFNLSSNISRNNISRNPIESRLLVSRWSPIHFRHAPAMALVISFIRETASFNPGRPGYRDPAEGESPAACRLISEDSSLWQRCASPTVKKTGTSKARRTESLFLACFLPLGFTEQKWPAAGRLLPPRAQSLQE
jgi:hypothetical protein